METATRRPRGRPRPKETVELDADVLACLKAAGPQTRNQLAQTVTQARATWAREQGLHDRRPAVDVKRVYLALRRLRDAGSVRKCAGEGAYTIWSASETCP
jgi:hypothetical protein